MTVKMRFGTNKLAEQQTAGTEPLEWTDVPLTVTKTSGSGNTIEVTAKKLGKFINYTVHITKTASTTAGDNMASADISGDIGVFNRVGTPMAWYNNALIVLLITSTGDGTATVTVRALINNVGSNRDYTCNLLCPIE